MVSRDFSSKWRSVVRKDEFVNQAPNDLTVYTCPDLESTTLLDSTKSFLIEGGLPKETAISSMTFDMKVYTPEVKSLKEHIFLEGNHFAHYYVIGNLENKWICINSTNKDQILAVDVDYPGVIEDGEEVSDEYQEEWFINSSVVHMAECLLAYQKLYYEGKFNDETAIVALRDELRQIDLPCVNEGTFWWREINYELLNQDI